MHYAKIFVCDIANGPGCRISLFVSGCRRHCPGCHNAEAWAFDYGQPFTLETENIIFYSLSPNYIQGLSILGGEPFEPENEGELVALAKDVRAFFPAKDIWVWSGYRLEELKGHPLLALCDYLVDGPYIEAERDLTLPYSGSRNQRVINLRKERV